MDEWKILHMGQRAFIIPLLSPESHATRTSGNNSGLAGTKLMDSPDEDALVQAVSEDSPKRFPIFNSDFPPDPPQEKEDS